MNEADKEHLLKENKNVGLRIMVEKSLPFFQLKAESSRGSNSNFSGARAACQRYPRVLSCLPISLYIFNLNTLTLTVWIDYICAAVKPYPRCSTTYFFLTPCTIYISMPT